MAQTSIGYDDTPVIPGSPYKVHDGSRPQPRIVTPGDMRNQGQPVAAPSDAIVLFDGTSLQGWTDLEGGDSRWKIENGAMSPVAGSGDTRTREQFGNCQLHLEWAAPTVVKGDSQGRGNSGVFLMGLYEIQVLDCFNNPTYADGTTASIYGQYPPLVNACRRPGEWQTYDIVWESPRFDGSRVVRPAAVTILHNGIVVHHHAVLQGPTRHRDLAHYAPHPATGPLQLQDHGDAVSFRNIWYRPLTGYDEV